MKESKVVSLVAVAGMVVLVGCGSASKGTPGGSGVKTLAFGELVNYHGAEIRLNGLDRNGDNLFGTFQITGLKDGASCPAIQDVYLPAGGYHQDPSGQANNVQPCTTLNKGEKGDFSPFWTTGCLYQSCGSLAIVLAPAGGAPVAQWTESSAPATTTSNAPTTRSIPPSVPPPYSCAPGPNFNPPPCNDLSGELSTQLGGELPTFVVQFPGARLAVRWV